MFGMNHDEKPSKLDDLIDETLSYMKGFEPTDEEYQNAITTMRMLLEAKAQEPKPKELDPNTVAVIAGNLTGIVLILAFEMRNVITSKSMNFVIKPKI